MTDLHMEHDEERGWRQVHFPKTYRTDDPELLKMKKSDLVIMIAQMSNDGKRLESYNHDLEEGLRETGARANELAERNAELIRRLANMHQAACATLHIIGGPSLGDDFEIEDNG